MLFFLVGQPMPKPRYVRLAMVTNAAEGEGLSPCSQLVFAKSSRINQKMRKVEDKFVILLLKTWNILQIYLKMVQQLAILRRAWVNIWKVGQKCIVWKLFSRISMKKCEKAGKIVSIWFTLDIFGSKVDTLGQNVSPRKRLCCLQNLFIEIFKLLTCWTILSVFASKNQVDVLFNFSTWISHATVIFPPTPTPQEKILHFTRLWVLIEPLWIQRWKHVQVLRNLS